MGYKEKVAELVRRALVSYLESLAPLSFSQVAEQT